jgi:hypothetical protein
MKKIGLLLMAIVLSIGALGVGYAAWTDQIFINGTVNTGEVNIDAEYFSGSEIYKDVDNETAYVRYWVKNAAGQLHYESAPVPTGNFVLVASASAMPGSGDDEVDIVFDGAFPSNSLVADVAIHNSGTVPVIVDADIQTDDCLLAWLWDNGYAYVTAAWVEMDDPHAFPEINGPVQMEPCDYVKIWVFLDLPQAEELEGTGFTQEDFMDKEWSFTANIYAIQWNEYEPGWWLP